MQNQINILSREKVTKQNRVWVRIASACNNRCIFCLDSNAHDWTFTDDEVVKKQICEWFKSWYDNRVIISWWEASINPKFTDYIKYAKQIGYNRVQTVTNGNMFASESFCKKVFDAWLEEVTFSFHWHNEKLHDYLVDTPWAFKKSLKGLINIKKNYPNIIVNIDTVVNKINVRFLPDIIKFFMKLGVYEYDILQIVPFWRGFQDNKDKLFYDIEENIKYLHNTWKLSKTPWMYMWTNRFPSEAFEWYEELIQDPRKIKSEVMWEWRHLFEPFIESNWEKILEDCYGIACDVCFLKQYCNDFIKNQKIVKINSNNSYEIIRGEEFPSQVLEKYWNKMEDFTDYMNWKIKDWKKLINIPKCLGGIGIYETYNDLKNDNNIEDYTYQYIKNLYRKKSLRCRQCKYYNECEWIHINFIKSYWFQLFNPIKWEK